jgi:hypothetical protein
MKTLLRLLDRIRMLENYRRKERMKRTSTIAVSILMLCSLLLATAGIANAGNMDYELTEYWAQVAPTIDGEWTSADEWTDAPTMNISDNAMFKYKVDTTATEGYMIDILVEFFNDTTDDAGDYYQFNFDNDNSGGTAPDTDCFMIEITGHTDLAFYQGNGAGWDDITAADTVEWADSNSSSPKLGTDHYILEMAFNKQGTIAVGAPPNGIRVAVYDASNPSAGVEAWAPGSSADVPDEWGVNGSYSSEPYVPEAFSVVVVILLSSVAVAVGFFFTRKHPKTVVNYKL